MTAKRWCVLAVGLWGVTTIAGLFIFVRGYTVPASDQRRAIVLNADERDLVLAEMRTMLGSVQGIVAGLAQKDARAVAEAARRSGSAAVQAVPPALMAKLPLEFKQLGGRTHQGFDEIAVAGDQNEPVDMLLTRLAPQIANCVACHDVFRLSAEAPQR